MIARLQPLRIAMLAVSLLAFFLRAHRLDGQSFWSDEGISLLRSSLPLGRMLAEMPVEHVPGYFVLLAGWIRLTGSEDFGLRYFSLWASVLAVALIFRFAADLSIGTARRNTAEAMGVVSALLMATNSFQLWYAQEVRMYSWLLFSSLAAGWLLWRMIAAPAVHPWAVAAGYIAAVTLSIYLHYYGFLIPVTHAVFVLGWLAVTRDWRIAGRWIACGAVVLLLFLPWLPRALDLAGFDGWRHPGEPAEIPRRFLSAFTVGAAMPAPVRTWLAMLYALLALVGILAWRRVRPAASWLLLTALLIPLAAVLAYVLRNPDYHERYAIALSVPLLVLVAGGLVGLSPHTWREPGGRQPIPSWRMWVAPLVAIALLLGTNGVALYRQYTDESLHKPDFRGAAWRIQQEETPHDVILVDGPDPEKVFLHYYSGPNQVYDLRALEDADWETVDAALREATAGHDDAWEVLYFHPPGPVQVWMAINGWAGAPSNHNDIRVVRYGLPGPAMNESSLNLDIGDALVLESAEISAGPLAAGDLLRVTTHWMTTSPPPEYKFSLRLRDAAGTMALARDYVPQNGFAPTNVWIVGQPAEDRRGVVIPPDLAAGPYQVTLRLYDPVTAIAVETAAGQDIPLGRVDILPTP